MLDANIPFYAALGNHDDPNQRFYKNFNMGGKRFYSYQKKDVRFFALDSNYMDKDQQRWLEEELSNSKSKWKIAYFHHPLYSNGGRHGSNVELRVRLEPLLVRHGVTAVFSGHDHMYERITPQQGITYFVAGAGGKLRKGYTRSENSAAAFDSDQSFMLVEIAGEEMSFRAVSRTGRVVDSGVVPLRTATPRRGPAP
jgi:3',5'-cyclic AMP phosphodiesterase CpdA